MDLRQNVRLQVLRLEHLRRQGQAAAIPGIADPLRWPPPTWSATTW